MLTGGPTPDPKCKLNIFIPYTPPFIRLSHLYQEFFVHYVIIIINWGMGEVRGKGD